MQITVFKKKNFFNFDFQINIGMMNQTHDCGQIYLVQCLKGFGKGDRRTCRVNGIALCALDFYCAESVTMGLIDIPS